MDDILKHIPELFDDETINRYKSYGMNEDQLAIYESNIDFGRKKLESWTNYMNEEQKYLASMIQKRSKYELKKGIAPSSPSAETLYVALEVDPSLFNKKSVSLTRVRKTKKNNPSKSKAKECKAERKKTTKKHQIEWTEQIKAELNDSVHECEFKLVVDYSNKSKSSISFQKNEQNVLTHHQTPELKEIQMLDIMNPEEHIIEYKKVDNQEQTLTELVQTSTVIVPEFFDLDFEFEVIFRKRSHSVKGRHFYHEYDLYLKSLLLMTTHADKTGEKCHNKNYLDDNPINFNQSKISLAVEMLRKKLEDNKQLLIEAKKEKEQKQNLKRMNVSKYDKLNTSECKQNKNHIAKKKKRNLKKQQYARRRMTKFNMKKELLEDELLLDLINKNKKTSV